MVKFLNADPSDSTAKSVLSNKQFNDKTNKIIQSRTSMKTFNRVLAVII